MPLADPIRRNNVTVFGNSKAKATILLSHGFGSDQQVWSELVGDFADHYRLVAFDHVGSGQSDPQAFTSARYLSLYRFAEDLVEICDSLDLRDIIAIGHSKGAMIAALAAISRPQRFTHQVLIGATPRYLNDDDYYGGFTREVIDSLYQTATTRYDDFVAGLADSFAGSGHAAFRDSFAQSLARIPPERAWPILCTVLLSDHRAEISRIKIPTLLIQPRADHAVPMEVAHYLHERIAGSQLSIIENDGHFPHVTAAAEVSEVIRRWLWGR